MLRRCSYFSPRVASRVFAIRNVNHPSPHGFRPSHCGHFSTLVEHESLPSGGHVSHMWLKGEKKYPILNPPAIETLVHDLKALDKDTDLRALFVRSTIAGADIHYMSSLKDAKQGVEFIRLIDRLCSTIQNLKVPVIAILDGPCMGAGLEFAASCDMRIAIDGPRSKFAMPETKIGIPSVVQASLLPGLIGWTRARQYLYFGNQFTAKEAFANGFVNELVSEVDLSQTLAKWKGWIDESEPHAVAAQKRLMRTWEEVGIGREGIEASIVLFGQSFETDIPQRRMASLIESLKARKRL